MTRVCNRCNVVGEFYKYTNGKPKHICKRCENTNASKYELYDCAVCAMVIRKRNKKMHENSHRHLINYFWNTNTDSMRLQPQNRRVYM